MRGNPAPHFRVGPRCAAFLDRDGVINRAYWRGGVSHPPRGLYELEILPGVASAARRLSDLGLTLIVVTNQPDVARGTQTRATVDAIHHVLQECLPLDHVVTCFHDASDDCACRKPRAGMLLDAAARYGVDLARSFMVGDRWSDVAAGRAAGCRTVLVGDSASDRARCAPDCHAADLPGAAEFIARSLTLRSRIQGPSVRFVEKRSY